jgi:uncharacterized membrane protein YtjA (UPF0391 family)
VCARRHQDVALVIGLSDRRAHCGIAGTAAGIAKILFFIFLVLWLVGFISSRRSI